MATFRKKRSRKYKRRNTRRNRRSKKSLVGGGIRNLYGFIPSKPLPTLPSNPAPPSEPDSPHMIVQEVEDVGQAPLVTTTTKTIDTPSVNSRITNLTDDIYRTLKGIQTDNYKQNNDNKLHSLMMIKKFLEILEGIKLSLSKSYDKDNHQEVYEPFKLYQDAILNIISINTEQERLTHIKNLSDSLSSIDFR
jgi:hypothetical protein